MAGCPNTLWGDVNRMCCPDEIISDCDPLTPDIPATYQYTNAEYLQIASNILYNRTCRRYGVCTEIIRPCKGCESTCHPCSCGGLYQPLNLRRPGYNLVSVDRVQVGSTILAASQYRVDDRYNIVRTDGIAWPACNNLSGATGDDGVFEIEYSYGTPVPLELRYAAEILACEIKSACNGSNKCRLPSNVVKTAKQGIAQEFTKITDMLAHGLTGVPEVDVILAGYDCNRRGMMVLHPLMFDDSVRVDTI